MNNSICIDASLALSWLLPHEQNEKTSILLRNWHNKGVKLITAPLFHAEVTSVLREMVYFRKIRPERGEELFSFYLRLGIENIGGYKVYQLAWELAKKFNLPKTYDMQYLAVAELEDCELWTCDKKFVNSLKGEVARIRPAG